jgi:sulfur carrier protein
MIVRINGQDRDVPPQVATVADLLAHLGIDAPGHAVALNRKVVPRSAHAATALTEGARVEILRAVGGG